MKASNIRESPAFSTDTTWYARQRACHWGFVICVIVSLLSFTLIWAPWSWLVFGGAGGSALSAGGMVYQAWRLARVRRQAGVPVLHATLLEHSQ